MTRSRFLSRGLPYIAGFFIQRLPSFALLPLFMVTMPAEDFTRLGLLLSAITLFSALLTLRVHVAPTRLIFDHDKQHAESSVILSSLILSIALFVVICAVLLVLSLYIEFDDYITKGDSWLLFSILLTVFFRMLTEMHSLLMRAKGKAMSFLYTASTEGAIILLVLAIYYFGSEYKYSIVVISLMLGAISSSIIAIVLLKGSYKGGRNDVSMYAEILRYSVPLGAYLIVNWVSVSSARWIGVSYIDMAELAAYTAVAMIFVVASVVLRVAFDVLRPEMSVAYAAADYSKGKVLLKRSEKVAYMLVFVLYIFIMLFVESARVLSEAYDFIVKENMPSLAFIIMALIASLFDVNYAKFTSKLVMLKKNHELLMMSFVSAFFIVGVNYLFVVNYDVDGLAVALPLSVLIQVIVIHCVMIYLNRSREQGDKW